MDLPPPPLFQDSVEKNIIPQVSIQSVLAKSDGRTTQVFRLDARESLSIVDKSFQESAGQLRRFKLQRLPPYIILHFKRFTKNIFVEEKNPTIVNFPLRGLDFRECKFVITRLTYIAHKLRCIDVDAPEGHSPTMYDLVANVIHESAAGTTRDKESTIWKVHIRAGSGGGENEKWFQIQDLIVEEIRKEMIFLGETVLQVTETSSCFCPYSYLLFRYGSVVTCLPGPLVGLSLRRHSRTGRSVDGCTIGMRAVCIYLRHQSKYLIVASHTCVRKLPPMD